MGNHGVVTEIIDGQELTFEFQPSKSWCPSCHPEETDKNTKRTDSDVFLAFADKSLVGGGVRQIPFIMQCMDCGSEYKGSMKINEHLNEGHLSFSTINGVVLDKPIMLGAKLP